MLTRPRPTDPTYRADLDVIGDVVEQTIRHREEAARAARPKWWRRAARSAFAQRAMLVPPFVIGALLVAGLLIRGLAVSPLLVAVVGGAGLAGYFWWRAIGAASPAAAMVRPVLAVAYLVASAVVA